MTHLLVTSEISYGIVIKLKFIHYEIGEEIKSFAEKTIKNASAVTYIDICRDGSRISVIFPEPYNSIKIFDINQTGEKAWVIKEILDIPLPGVGVRKCCFNPMNKNYIFMIFPNQYSLISLIDSFAPEYTITERSVSTQSLDEYKGLEEEKLKKRYEVFSYFAKDNFKFEDFSWDRYNRVYLSETYQSDSGDLSGELHFIDPIKLMQLQKEKPELFNQEPTENVEGLSYGVTAMVLTQRYLVCALSNGNVALVNMFLPDKDLKEYKNTLGSSYQKLIVDKEMMVTKSNQILEYITSMKYDLDYSKILAKTSANNLYVLFLKGEILEKNIEDKVDTEEQGHEIDNFEEVEFHQGRILGIRELGKTTELVSISDEDRKVIFRDYGKKEIIASHILDYVPTVFEVNPDGSLLFIASSESVFRIYDITHRTSMRLVYRMKFEYKKSKHINRILVHPLMKYIIFYEKGGRYLYFLSGEVSKKFTFLGFLKIPTKIIDVSINNVQGEDFSTDPITLASILVLVNGILLLYNISKFFTDNKQCWDIQDTKVDDIFANFQLSAEPKARKVDGDLNYILKNKTSKPLKSIWLTGTDKMFRIFPLPVDKLDSVKESKKPIETPEEIPAHELPVVHGYLYNDNFVISVGKDGYINVRKDKKLIKKFRSHSYANGGITSVYYSAKRKILFTSGNDGSISIVGFDFDVELPESDQTTDLSNQVVETLEAIEPLEDSLCPNFVTYVYDQHQNLIKKAKAQSQTELKSMYDEIKVEQNKLFNENSKLEEHEQLKENEMIIDLERIDEEHKKNQKIADDLTKTRFRELCEMELQKKVLFEKTYNQMREKEEDKTINNNIRLVFNSTGDRELQTYALPNVSEKMKNRLNYIKQLRLLQKMEEYKRRNEGTGELIDQKLISSGTEQYILNRTTVKPTIIEQEVILNEDGEQQSLDGQNQAMLEDKTRSSVAKYRLQRNPYEEINKKGDDGGEQLSKGPEEQIYKDDLQMEYRTIIELKDPPDLEFKPLNEISSYSLLYSPFELYTNSRIRNQIVLLLDVIHELKKTFNSEYLVYIKERNQLLEKFNTNKGAIEAIKEILTDIQIKDYTYAMNPHEDNEWVEKFDESDVKVPRYYSKEEKRKMAEEAKAEEERLKALQGDTMQMRGLHFMINTNVKKKKDNEGENELVREPWMNKKREEMTDEQVKLFLEFQRKEMELREQKEKIRSQNLTKLNFHKSEIENNQIDLDMKFAKILRKKLHYDTLVAEQEIYILSLIQLLQRREAIKKQKGTYETQLKESEEIEKKAKERKEKFEISNENLRGYIPTEDKEKDRQKPMESQAKGGNVNPQTEEYLHSIKNDPYYFFDKQRLENIKLFGDKEYREFHINPEIKNQNQQMELKKYFDEKYYFDYKKKQFERHTQFLDSEYIIASDKAKELKAINDQIINDMEKLKLDYSIMIKLRRGQDEITDGAFMEKVNEENENRTLTEENNSENDNSQSGEENADENQNQENEEMENNAEENELEEQNMNVIKYTLGVPVESSLLVDISNINELNQKLQGCYNKKMAAEKTNKDHTQMKQYLTLENELLQVLTMDITLKMKYLKLTRVTKKIQEVVTGKEEVNQQQIAKLYEDKKRNLEENTTKRIQTLDAKLKEINSDIRKKVEENTAFEYKLKNLKEDVEKTKQIIRLDAQIEGEEDNYNDDEESKQMGKSSKGPANKSLEIAEVSKLKAIVKNYYEEIEYLRAELDKLRARTFPSFLQKPDNVIYPDEK